MKALYQAALALLVIGIYVAVMREVRYPAKRLRGPGVACAAARPIWTPPVERPIWTPPEAK